MVTIRHYDSQASNDVLWTLRMGRMWCQHRSLPDTIQMLRPLLGDGRTHDQDVNHLHQDVIDELGCNPTK